MKSQSVSERQKRFWSIGMIAEKLHITESGDEAVDLTNEGMRQIDVRQQTFRSRMCEVPFRSEFGRLVHMEKTLVSRNRTKGIANENCSQINYWGDYGSRNFRHKKGEACRPLPFQRLN